MNRLLISGRSGRNWSRTGPAAIILPLALALGPPITSDSATNTVTSLADGGAGSLRQTIADSAPGDTIVFSVRRVTTPSSGELVLDQDITIIGPGASVLAIDADYRSRVIRVATNTTASLSGLTLRKGCSQGAGGGIYNAGALSIRNCVICSNLTSLDTNGFALPGGGVYNVGTLALDNSTVSFNRTATGIDGGSSYDRGYNGGDGGDGGGVWNSGVFSATLCQFNDNTTGGGGHGGSGRVTGGSGGNGGSGGGIYSWGTMTLSSCTLSNNATGSASYGGSGQASAGGPGAGGAGGAIFSGNAVLVGCTVVSNWTGSGGSGGGSLTPSGGGPGGSGAGVYAWGLLLLTNCTVAGNSCGTGGYGPMPVPWLPVRGGFGGSGGGLYWSGTSFAMVACTIVNNSAGPGGPSQGGSDWYGSNGQGGGVGIDSGITGISLNSLVALNSGTGSNVFGAFNSLGYNLIGTTNGASGFNGPGDLAGSDNAPLDPKIGTLGDYGGPTSTAPLLLGSSAIDHGAVSGIAGTDQRGIPRPQGLRADIGAFEFEFKTPLITRAEWLSSSDFWIQSCGLPNCTYKLQISTDLRSWYDRADLITGPVGIADFTDSGLGSPATRFYRLKAVSP